MMDRNEKRFYLSLAGHSFAVHSLYEQVYTQCENYMTDEPAEVEIVINENDIAAEKEEAIKNRTTVKEPYLETLAVYRKISEAALDFDVFLMHGAVVAYGNSAYMFTATSGTGKTTHIKKWLENLEGSFVVNGDKPLIRITETEAIACGTPWCGKEHLERNCMVPLKAIALMERGENNEIHEISFRQAFPFLLQQTYAPTDTDKMKKTLKLLSMLKGRVKFYKYVFNNMKDDAFEVAYGAMKGE